MNDILKLILNEGDSINDAINKVYCELQNNGSYKSAEIVLNGTFRTTEPIKFRTGCTFPITIKGGENAVIDGGWHIQNFSKTIVNNVGVWCAKVDRDRTMYMRFDQLFVNGQRRYRPIYPENAFLGVTGVLFDGEDKISMSLEQKERDWCKSNSVFSYKHELPQFSRINDIEFAMNHCWLHERMRVSKIDYNTKLIYTESGSLFAGFEDEKIYLENVFEELKSPGQWYYDKTNSLIYYIPKEGETLETVDIVIPIVDEFIVAEKVANKHIANIKFQYCSSRYEYEVRIPERSKGLSIRTSRQAECEVPGCIQFISAQHCSVSGCTMEHLGRYGIEINNQSAYIEVYKNIFSDLGTGAVKTYFRDAFNTDINESEASYLQITDNDISHYGMLYKAATGILLTNVNHCTVAHNEIHHGEYSAISCGWVWGYGQSNNGYNKIEYNYLHHIGNNSVCDMGAIYMLGVQPCTLIRNNLIHDVIDREQNGWGIYLDEGSSHITVENNVVYRVSTEAMHIHYGRENRIINNIFAFGDIALISNTRHEPHVQLIVERNIFYSNNGRILRIKRGEGAIEADKNIYFTETGDISFCHNNYEKDMVYMPYKEWKKTGNDRFSMNCNPLFEDVENFCFKLQENSPAYKIGFCDIDLSSVGIRKN